MSPAAMGVEAIRRVAVAALLVLPLAACGGLRSKQPAEQVYVLRPETVAAAPAQAPVAGVLAVRRPEVQPGLDTARIALVQPGNRLDYFAASRWSGTLPQVVDAFATQTLLKSGAFAQVNGSDRGSGGARYLLWLTVRHFEADYSAGGQAAPKVHVAFECVLTTGARAPLGRCDGEAIVPAAENRMGPIVAAFEAAARQAMAQVTMEAARLAAQAPTPGPPEG